MFRKNGLYQDLHQGFYIEFLHLLRNVSYQMSPVKSTSLNQPRLKEIEDQKTAQCIMNYAYSVIPEYNNIFFYSFEELNPLYPGICL